MKHKTIYISILLLLLSSLVTAQNKLNGYLETAAANNPGLQAKFNEYMAALEVAPQVNTLPDPQLAFALFISPVETRVGPQQLKISASQFFPWFGTLDALEKAAAEAAKAKYEQFEEAKSKLFNDVKAEYFNLYLNRKSSMILKENIRLLQSIQQIATIKIEAGSASMADEYRLEMELNELKNELAKVDDNQAALETGFKNLLHNDEAFNIELPDSLWETNFAHSKSAALDSVRLKNHRLLELDMKQAALTYRKEAATHEGKPGFKVGIDYTVIGKGDNNLSGKDALIFPSVGISIPLYRNKYKAMVNEVAYLETANRLAASDKANSLETLFEKSWNEYTDAARRIGLNGQQLELARKTLNVLESEYVTSGNNFEELLRIERKVLQYHLAFEIAKTDKQAAVAFLNYLMGKGLNHDL
jgi:cobalt-zinc-cadmium efflux system outer membrane protein